MMDIFTMIFDYHNLHQQGMLRSVAHPQGVTEMGVALC